MPVRVVAIGKKTKGGEIPTQRWRDSYTKVERFLHKVERFLHKPTF
jgi:hypothetical protein